MSKNDTFAPMWERSGRWSETVCVSDGSTTSRAREVSSELRLTPQEIARRRSLRICGVSRYRCRDHISRPGCGRILSLSCVDAGSASGVE